MKAKNIYSYIRLGMAFRYLLDAEQGYPIHGDRWILANIDILFEIFGEFELYVTRRASAELDAFAKSLRGSPANARLSDFQAKRLEEIMLSIRPTLSAESMGRLAYSTTDKRIDVEKLLGKVGGLFGQKVFGKLPEITQFDFTEAGKCIAFELPTAGAFHLLRGTECAIRTFYCRIVRRNRVKKLLWGPMIEHLRRRRKPPPEILLNNLDNIRVSFRNPTQHPEKRYDIDEAQDLFSLCIEVVNRMCTLGL